MLNTVIQRWRVFRQVWIETGREFDTWYRKSPWYTLERVLKITSLFLLNIALIDIVVHLFRKHF